MGKLAVIGEQHEPAGGEVEAPHHHPAPRGRGQEFENRGSTFRVVAGADHIGRLMHANHTPAAGRRGLGVARLAVNGDAVADVHALAQHGGLVVNGDATSGHQRLDFAT